MNNPELGQVFTSPAVAKFMVSLLGTDKNGSILDPCFGGGAFLRALENAAFQNITGYEIDEYWYNKANEYFHSRLYLCDFLKIDGKEIFDGIIMNPPYIRQERIDDLSGSGITKKWLFSNELFSCLPKTANLYMFFIVKAIDMLKENGEMVVIFPSSWMAARGGKAFKNYIENHVCITKQIDVYGEVFDGDALVEVSILKMIKSHQNSDTVIEKYKVFDGIMIKDDLNDISESFALPVHFSEYATTRRGLTTGYNNAFINPRTTNDFSEFLVPIISSPKSFEGYNTDNAKTDQLLYIKDAVELPDSMKEYLIGVEKDILQSGSPKTICKKIEQKKKWYTMNIFSCDGIIFSYFVRNEMRFVLNTAGTLVRDNFYIIYPNIDPYIMLALLNNYYTFYQLEKSGKKYGAGLLKIQRYDIEDLSFPDVKLFSKSDLKSITDLSMELVSTGNVDLVEQITEVLSNYIDGTFEQIKSVYQNEKHNRLERV